jgi:hypothetical protein
MKFKSVVFVFIIPCLLFMTLPACGQQTDADKIERLEGQLATLADDGLTWRLIGGWSLIGLGGLLTGCGVYVFARGPAEINPFFADLTAAAGAGGLLLGGGMSGAGLLLVLSPSSAEAQLAAFRTLPGETGEERAGKALMGEKMLRDLSQRGMIERIIIGCVFLTGAAVQFCAFGYLGATSPGFSEPTVWILGGLALAEGAIGLVALLVPSLAEREWQAYREWTAAGGSAAAARSGETALSMTLTPTGFALRLAF